MLCLVIDAFYCTALVLCSGLPMLDEPKLLQTTLHPYQKQALYWMSNREKGIESASSKQQSGEPVKTSGARKLHPLWVEYRFPAEEQKESKSNPEDATVPAEGSADPSSEESPDSADRPAPSSPSLSFYLNPFTFAVSLRFPSAKGAARGGILGDQMGMGKTIETLALILYDLERFRLRNKKKRKTLAGKDAEGGRQAGDTLRQGAEDEEKQLRPAEETSGEGAAANSSSDEEARAVQSQNCQTLVQACLYSNCFAADTYSTGVHKYDYLFWLS